MRSWCSWTVEGFECRMVSGSGARTGVSRACAKARTDSLFRHGLGRPGGSITDRSGVPSQCTYTTDNYNRSFALPANSKYDLRIVPAVRQFRNWTVTITCDNGTSTTATTYF